MASTSPSPPERPRTTWYWVSSRSVRKVLCTVASSAAATFLTAFRKEAHSCLLAPLRSWGCRAPAYVKGTLPARPQQRSSFWAVGSSPTDLRAILLRRTTGRAAAPELIPAATTRPITASSSRSWDVGCCFLPQQEGVGEVVINHEPVMLAGASTAPSTLSLPLSRAYEHRCTVQCNRGRLHWHTVYTAKLTGTHS